MPAKKVIEFTRESGWFQAPVNLGFVVIGLLYGEGDFRKSLLYAVNCGDDTDCTAATVGATLGIMGGTAAIPEDWKAFVGDRIITLSISGMYERRIPRTCTELTERIAALVPAVMKACKVDFAFGAEECTPPSEWLSQNNSLRSVDLMGQSPYSYEVTHYRAFKVRVELDDTPRVFPGDKRNVKLTFFCTSSLRETRKLQLRLLLPDTWSAGPYQKTLSLMYPQPLHGIYGDVSTSFTIYAGEQVEAVNRAYMEVTCPTLVYPVMVPITFIG